MITMLGFDHKSDPDENEGVADNLAYRQTVKKLSKLLASKVALGEHGVE